MKKNNFIGLIVDIKAELVDLEDLVNEAKEVQSSFKDSPNHIQLRALGSILHDLYTGMEKIFQLVAQRMEKDIPTGEDWHIQLLKRMANSVPDIRPAVFSNKLEEQLNDFLRFRHLFRNIYGFELEWEKIKPLLERLPGVFSQFKKELKSFENFLKKL